MQELEKLIDYHGKVWAANTALNRQQLVKYMTVEMTAPCVLHMDSRVVEVLLHNLLVQATTERYYEGDSQTRKACVLAIEEYMNDHVYGNKTHDQKGQWKFPEEDGVVLKRTLSGNNAKKVMRHLAKLADIVFRPKFDESAPTKQTQRAARKDNDNRRIQWKAMMDPYIKFWTVLTRKRGISLMEKLIRHMYWEIRSLGSMWICFLTVSALDFCTFVSFPHLTCSIFCCSQGSRIICI